MNEAREEFVEAKYLHLESFNKQNVAYFERD
jgi:hypothetical protein